MDAPATKKHANTPPHLATVGGPADRVKSLNDSIFAGVEDIASNAGNTVAPIPLQKHAAPATPAAEPAKVPRGGSAAPSARIAVSRPAHHVPATPAASDGGTRMASGSMPARASRFGKRKTLQPTKKFVPRSASEARCSPGSHSPGAPGARHVRAAAALATARERSIGANMNPRRAQLASTLTLLAVVVAARHAAGQAIPSAETRTRTTGQTQTQTARVSHRPAGRPVASAAASGRDALPSDVSAPRLTSRRASLRLCDGGDPVPTTVFAEETLCLEQPLPGVTRGEARRRALHAASVDVTFADDRVAPEHVGDPELVTPSDDDDDDDDDAAGVDELLRIDDEETLEEETSPDDAVEDVFVRFTLSVAGLPAGAKGALEAAVTVVPVGRFSHEIVWYELSVTYPTFYSHQVDVVVQEGHDAGKPEEEIEQDVEDLVEGTATFFPCTNFIAGPFCDEAGISA